MANSIPYDPTLVLGNLIDPVKIDQLKAIAEVQKPTELALARFNGLTAQAYKIDMIYREMENLSVRSDALKKINNKRNELKNETAKAAIALAKSIIETENQTTELILASDQSQISVNIESPLDYDNSKVEKFPLAFDALQFDVQYVRVETSEDSTKASSSNTSSTAADTLRVLVASHSAMTANSVAETSLSQYSQHNIEGTIVICAHATHKNAHIIEPLVLDPKKAVKAWNYNFPDDRIQVDPQSIMAAAFEPEEGGEGEKKVLNLLSGCTRASTFVGMVHILQQESTESSQKARSTARTVQESLEVDLFIASIGASSGRSSSSSNTASKLLSTSTLQNHASIICNGIIPSIVADSVTTTVKNLKPSPGEVMQSLGAISNATDSAVNSSIEAFAGSGKVGADYMKLDGEFIKNTVHNLGEYTNDKNRVINTNTMFEAFSDFVRKAMAGDAGVPNNFFTKELTKADIAKEYMIKFYPNGATGRDGLKGQLGLTNENTKT